MSGFDLARSEALHQRVRNFAQSLGCSSDDFDGLAIDIAAHQIASGAGLDRLMAAQGQVLSDIGNAASIPALPTDVFKLRRVACHPAKLDVEVFQTSGTTLGTRGKHALRTTQTYQYCARAWAKHMLLPDTNVAHWILLAAPFQATRESSLGFMLNDLASAFGVPASEVSASGAIWAMPAKTSDAIQAEKLDLDVIKTAVRKLRHDEAPIVLAGASFAFVHLLDALGASTIDLGRGARIMQTGGFKGRSREVDAEELRARICLTFRVPPSHVVSEYGMTELCSQAYETSLRASMVGEKEAEGVFLPPPWMRIIPVDPESLKPVPMGEVGIARIEDLANVDSAIAIQTADRVQVCKGGIRLLGRLPGAAPRGCSIGIDEVLAKS